MVANFALLAVLVGLPLLIIWFAKRDRKRTSRWGRESSQSNIVTGAQWDSPQIVPVEPLDGPSVNGEPTEDLSHRGSIHSTGGIND